MGKVLPFVFVAALAACSESPQTLLRGDWELADGKGGLSFARDKVTAQFSQIGGTTEYLYEVTGTEDGWWLMRWSDREGEALAVKAKRDGDSLTIEAYGSQWTYRRKS